MDIAIVLYDGGSLLEGCRFGSLRCGGVLISLRVTLFFVSYTSYSSYIRVLTSYRTLFCNWRSSYKLRGHLFRG